MSARSPPTSPIPLNVTEGTEEREISHGALPSSSSSSSVVGREKEAIRKSIASIRKDVKSFERLMSEQERLQRTFDRSVRAAQAVLNNTRNPTSRLYISSLASNHDDDEDHHGDEEEEDEEDGEEERTRRRRRPLERKVKFASKRGGHLTPHHPRSSTRPRTMKTSSLIGSRTMKGGGERVATHAVSVTMSETDTEDEYSDAEAVAGLSSSDVVCHIDELDELGIEGQSTIDETIVGDLPSTFVIPRAVATPDRCNARARICFGVGQAKGGRAYQEDTFLCRSSLSCDGDDDDDDETASNKTPSDDAFFAVYDGHHGARTSVMLRSRLHKRLAEKLRDLRGDDVTDVVVAKKTLLTQTFVEIDRAYLREIRQMNADEVDTSGSTACCALISNGTIFVANAGDSRCVVCRQGGRAVALSRDHKATDSKEKARIEDAGGEIRSGRVMGTIGVSRAFGDIELKRTNPETKKLYWDREFTRDLVTAEPDVIVHPILASDEFLVIASDGIWDALKKNRHVTNFVRRELQQNPSVRRAAENLVKFVVKRMGKRSDNCTVVIVMLNQDAPGVSDPDGDGRVERAK